MRILFLEVDTEQSWAVASLGPAFIASYLRAHDHEVDYLRVGVDMTPAQVTAEVRARRPGLLGLSITSRQWLRARDLVAAIRSEVDVPVLAGGLHPTFSPEAVLAAPGFDYVCLGEGEEATLDLIKHMERGLSTSRIRNIGVAGNARPELRPPFDPIDELPFMARDLLDEYHGCYHVTTQRGCPFPCTYCAARKYNDLYEGVGEYGRRRSHENVLAELEALQEHGLSYVIFLDDTFTIHHPWVKAFCGLLRDRFPSLGFSLHARVETVSEKLIGILAEAGCKHITYGVESGSERIRREVMKRPVTNQRFKDVFRWTQEAGILPTANYMLGLPEETPADIDMTLELAEELGATDFGYFVFYPYPGTHLFHYCKERGYLPENYLERPANNRTSILTLPTLSQADIDDGYRRFTELRARVSADRFPEEAAAQTARDSVWERAAKG